MNVITRYIALLSLIVFNLLFNFSIAQERSSSTKITSNELSHKLDSLFNEWNGSDNPGITVGVVKDGNVLFAKGYGMANLEYNIPNSPSTIYHIASVSKQFTAFCALLLAEEGKISMEDDVRKYIPELPDFGSVISLRNLANHTSGLRDQFNLLSMAGWRLDDIITQEQVLKIIFNQKELNFEPGTAFDYTNTGYTLLAEVVSRVAGKSFAEYAKNRLFSRHKMSHSFFMDKYDTIIDHRAYSYYQVQKGYKKGILNFSNIGPTNLMTTVDDLCKWMIYLDSLEMHNSKLLKDYNKRGVLKNGDITNHAMGQYIENYKGLRLIQHAGGDSGFRSILARFPDQNLGIVVLSNEGNIRTDILMFKVADILLEQNFVKLKRQASTDHTFKSLNPKSLEKYTGTYWLDRGGNERKIFIENDTLKCSLWNSSFPLLPISKDKFEMLNVGFDLVVQFKVDGNDKMMIFDIDNGQMTEHYHAYEPVKNLILGDFIGSYYSEELETNLDLVIENGKLVGKHQRLGDTNFSVIKTDEFVGDKWYYAVIKFKRDKNGQVCGFLASNGRVKNLLFKKFARNFLSN